MILQVKQLLKELTKPLKHYELNKKGGVWKLPPGI